MSVPRVLTEKCGRVVFRLHRDETVVTAKSPAAAVPLHATAEVAGEERVGVIDAEVSLLSHREAADSSRRVWHERTVRRCRKHDVAAVVDEVRRFRVRGHAREVEAL